MAWRSLVSPSRVSINPVCNSSVPSQYSLLHGCFFFLATYHDCMLFFTLPSPLCHPLLCTVIASYHLCYVNADKRLLKTHQRVSCTCLNQPEDLPNDPISSGVSCRGCPGFKNAEIYLSASIKDMTIAVTFALTIYAWRKTRCAKEKVCLIGALPE